MNSAEQPYINPQEHLSEKQLMRYELGQMDGAEMQRVEQHLLDCEFCSDALEGIALLEAGELEGAVQDIKGRLWERISQSPSGSLSVLWKWGIAASILLLFTSALFLLFQEGAPGDKLLVQMEDKNPSQPELPVPTKAEEPDTITSTEAIAAEAEDGPGTSSPKPVQPEKPAAKEKTASSRQFSFAEPKQNPETTVSESTAEAMEEASAEERVFELEAEESLTEEIVFDAEPELAEAAPAEREIPEPAAGHQAALAKKKEERKDLQTSLKDTEGRWDVRSLDVPSKNVKGKVTDAAGEPLPGVNIRLKGSGKGTLTDDKGEYALVIPFADTSLILNAIGYASKEVTLKDTAFNANTVLQEEVLALEEVVVSETSRSRKEQPGLSPPKPEAGWSKFRRYLKENQIYPAAAKEAGIAGTVVLTFMVLPDGSLQDFQLLNSLGYGLDEESIRLVKSGPAWQPAISEKEPVTQKVKVKVHFTLE